MEIICHVATNAPMNAAANLVMDKQKFPGFKDDAGSWHFVLSPKDSKTWNYTIQSSVPALDGQTGGFASYRPALGVTTKPSAHYPNWWTDDPNPALAERDFAGVKTVSQWREDFLRDFARRMKRCSMP